MTKDDANKLLAAGVMKNKPKDVEKALKGGADPNSPNPYSDSKKRIIFYARDPKILGMLLDAGADPNVKNSTGTFTLLETTISDHEGGVDKLKLLIKAGVDLNSKVGNPPASIFHALLAMPDEPRYKEYINELLKAGVDINIKDNIGRTPLDVAIVTQCGYGPTDERVEKAKKSEVVKFLISKGAKTEFF